jgi:hypothetical protein
MFTRQEVCVLTGIPVERFKSLIRRDQIAIILPDGPGWNYFSAMDVFKIAIQERLSCQIGYADGLPADTAAMISDNNKAALWDFFWQFPAGKAEPDKWIGYVGFSGDLDVNNGGKNIFGTLSEVTKSIERTKSDEPMRVFLVNADSVLREVAARAIKHLNIDFIVSGKTEMADSARD